MYCESFRIQTSFLRHEKLQQEGEETGVGWNTVVLDHHVGILLIIGYVDMIGIICRACSQPLQFHGT